MTVIINLYITFVEGSTFTFESLSYIADLLDPWLDSLDLSDWAPIQDEMSVTVLGGLFGN